MYIYCIENLVTGKKYVGKRSAKSEGDSYFGSGIALADAIKKYGKKNFKKTILEDNIPDNALANERERHWIKELNTKKPNGYNLTDGGDGGLGMSEESVQRANAKRKGRYVGPKHPMYGKKHSPEARRKITLANAALKLKPEYIERQTLKGLTIESVKRRVKWSVKRVVPKRHSEQFKRRMAEAKELSRVIELDVKSGSVINIFHGLHDAAKKTGLDRLGIRQQCRGKKTKCDRRFIPEEDYLAILSAGAILSLDIPKAGKKGAKIVQLDKQGGYINSFDSIREAEKAVGISFYHIDKAIRNHEVIMDFIFVNKNEHEGTRKDVARLVVEKPEGV